MVRSQFRKGMLIATAVACTAALSWGVADWQRGAIGQESKISVSKSAPDHVAGPADKAAVNEAKSLSRAFRKAAEVASPSVVTIQSKTKAKAQEMGQGEDPLEQFKGTPFEQFFKGRGLGDMRGFKQRTPAREGMGSGVIIDKSGIVLTNNHVVEGADEVTVQLSDGREFKAEDIKTDEATDLAVLRIKGAGSLPAATLGDSDSLEIGDWVIAIGNPFGLDHTVSAGIISGKGRELGSIKRAQFVQTDAAINPGNSGGPLVDLNGEVVGINTAIATHSGQFAGVGFALPINTAKWVTNQLIKKGAVDRAYLGVAIGNVNKELAEKFGVQRNEGVLVSEVFPNSPAAVAGFREGDIITGFGGQKIHNPRELQERVERLAMGAKENVEVVRDGKRMTLAVAAKPLPKNFGTAQAKPADDNDESPEKPTVESNKLGIEVTEMTAENADSLGYAGFTGVLISKVEHDSPAAEQGLQPGMLVMKIGTTHVKTVQEFQAAVKNESLKNGVLLLVRTKAGNRFVVLGDKS